MPVKVKGKLLGSAELDIIRLVAGTTASMKGKGTTITGEVTMVIEGGTVQMRGGRVFVTSEKGVVEIAAPEVKITTPGGTATLNAAGVSIKGAVVRLNCG